MANEVQKFIRNDSIQKRINDLLDKRAGQFTTSLLTAVNSNDRLAHCTPESVLNAALTAASLDLPINPNLGFAALVPYGNEVQFQLQYKGLIQLAQRSGKYRTISVAPVFEGQLISNDPLRGITFDWSVTPEPDATPIGYAAYIELINGFEKTMYMTYEQVEQHATRYSKAYNYDQKSKKSSSPWSTNFDAMANKTVLKKLLSTFGILSTEMQTAIESDQAIITDNGVKYVDNDSALENVNATDDQKQAIIDANKTDEPVAPIAEEEPPTPQENVDAVFGNSEVEAEAPKESVKEKAARKYGSKLNDTSS